MDQIWNAILDFTSEVRHPRLGRAHRAHPDRHPRPRRPVLRLAAVPADRARAAAARQGPGPAGAAARRPHADAVVRPDLRGDRDVPRPVRARLRPGDPGPRPRGPVLTLLYWGAEAMRDYDHTAERDDPPGGRSTRRPPPGVHMPGPSFRPILAAIAVAVILYGLVLRRLAPRGGDRDARRQPRRLAPRRAGASTSWPSAADATGHLDALPAPRVPTGTFAFFGALFVLALILNSGMIPSGCRQRLDRWGGTVAGRIARGERRGTRRPVRRAARQPPGDRLSRDRPGHPVQTRPRSNATADKPFTIALRRTRTPGSPTTSRSPTAAGTIVFRARPSPA